NIGAFLAPLTCGYLGQRVGWEYGFLAAGLGMLLGMIEFFLNFRHLEGKGHAPESGAAWRFMGIGAFPLTLLGCVAIIPVFSFLINSEGVTDWLLFAAGAVCLGYLLFTAFTAEDRVEGQRLFVFLILFFFHMIFWVLFEQAGGSINILTDRYVNRAGIEASMFQSVNALFIMLLAPVFNWLWGWLAKNKLEPRTPMKFFYGLIQMAIGYMIIVWGVKVGIANGAGATAIPMGFLIGMYLLHTTGELFLSPVGLSVVTKLSPQKVVGFVMGSWFLSIAFAHKVAGKLGQMIASTATGGDDPKAELMGFMDVYLQWGVYVVLGCAAVLLVLTPTMKKWMHGIN
ncbi:MAG: oligopeptide:H+ symporter, partial [Flavobacteriales bacterium]|nr:oligopeptide:H+ symporter [Flavobacteriales bacterium]